MKDLKDIQIQIKKELGGASLNHLIIYASLAYKKYQDFVFAVRTCFDEINQITLVFALKDQGLDNHRFDIFLSNFILLNDQNQALNIFGQSEQFQRNLYDAIQFIKNINNK